METRLGHGLSRKLNVCVVFLRFVCLLLLGDEMLTLSTDARDELDAAFTLKEIKSAGNSVPNEKAPGCNGFGTEFYKTYADAIASLLLRMIRCSMDNIIFPGSLYEANTCLTLEK